MKTESFRVMTSVGLLAMAMGAPAHAQIRERSFFELAGAETKYNVGDFNPAPEKKEIGR